MNHNSHKILLVTLLGSFLTSCQTRIVPVSQRSYQQPTRGKLVNKRSREIRDPGATDRPQIFVKKSQQKILQSATAPVTGSLVSLDNPEHFLFRDMPKGRVGDMLKVIIIPENTENPEATTEKKPEEIQDELLKALEQLSPLDKTTKTITSLSFRVDRVLPNGDAIVSYARTSINDEESNAIRVAARIPRLAILEKKALTTHDVLDIDWYESKNGEVVERSARTWHDEYTLRLSGFEEAKSEYAQNLKEKEKAVQEVSNKLRDRINGLGAERRKIAETRQDLVNREQRLADSLGRLQGEIDGQKSQIEEQKSIMPDAPVRNSCTTA